MTGDEMRMHLWVQHGWSKATNTRLEGIRQPERWHSYEHEHRVGVPRWEPHQHQPMDLSIVADVDGEQLNSA